MPMSSNRQVLGNPKIIIVISGKRKSGKDYVANILLERFGSGKAVIIRLSGPLKERYALENNLDYAKLLEASEYKELYRLKMIKWGEDIRCKDPGYFCRHAIEQSQARSKAVWIVSDARRKTDVEFFLSNFPNVTYTLRISASPEVRKQRGWRYTEGIDDCESECGLDDFTKWNYQIDNDNSSQLLEEINKILFNIKKKLCEA